MSIFSNIANHPIVQKLKQIKPRVIATVSAWSYTHATNSSIRDYNAVMLGNNPNTTLRTSLQFTMSAISTFIFREGLDEILNNGPRKFAQSASILIRMGYEVLFWTLMALPFVLQFQSPETLQNRPYQRKVVDFLNKYYTYILSASTFFYAAAFTYTGAYSIPVVMAVCVGLGILQRYNLIPDALNARIEKAGDILSNLYLLTYGPISVKLSAAYNLFGLISIQKVNSFFIALLDKLPIPFVGKYKRAYIIGSKIHEKPVFQLKGKVETEEEMNAFLDAITKLPNHQHIKRVKPSRAFVQNIKATDLLPVVGPAPDGAALMEELNDLPKLFNEKICHPYLSMTPEQRQQDRNIKNILIKLKDDWQTRGIQINLVDHHTRLRNLLNNHNNPDQTYLEMTASHPENQAPKGSIEFWSYQIDKMANKEIANLLLKELKNGLDPMEYITQRLGALVYNVGTGDMPSITPGRKAEVLRMLRATVKGLRELHANPQNEEIVTDVLVSLGIEAGKYCDTGITAAVERCYKVVCPHLPPAYSLSSDKRMALALGSDREAFFNTYYERKIQHKFTINLYFFKFQIGLPAATKNWLRNTFLVDVHGRNELVANDAPRLFPDFSVQTDAANQLTEVERLHNSGFSNMPTLPFFMLPFLFHNNVEYKYWKYINTERLLNDIQQRFLNKEFTMDGYFMPWIKELIENSDFFADKKMAIEQLADYDVLAKMINFKNGSFSLTPGFLTLLGLSTGVLYIDDKNNYLQFENGELTLGNGADECPLDDLITPKKASLLGRLSNYFKNAFNSLNFFAPSAAHVSVKKETKESNLRNANADAKVRVQPVLYKHNDQKTPTGHKPEQAKSSDNQPALIPGKTSFLLVN